MQTAQGQSLWNTLVENYDANRFACTLQAAREFTATIPENPVGWLILGETLTWGARYKEATAAIKKAARLFPIQERYRAYQQLGHLYSDKCDLKRAEKWYRKTTEDHPSSRTFIYLGGCLAVQGLHSAAQECYEIAIELRTDMLDEAYYNLGLILRAQGGYDEALSCFKKAIKINPNSDASKAASDDLKTYLKMVPKKKKRTGSIHIGKKRR